MQMHYNLNERLKVKKRNPYKRAIIILILVLAVIGAYFAFSHKQLNFQKTPAAVQRQPA